MSWMLQVLLSSLLNYMQHACNAVLWNLSKWGSALFSDFHCFIHSGYKHYNLSLTHTLTITYKIMVFTIFYSVFINKAIPKGRFCPDLSGFATFGNIFVGTWVHTDTPTYSCMIGNLGRTIFSNFFWIFIDQTWVIWGFWPLKMWLIVKLRSLKTFKASQDWGFSAKGSALSMVTWMVRHGYMFFPHDVILTWVKDYFSKPVVRVCGIICEWFSNG